MSALDLINLYWQAATCDTMIGIYIVALALPITYGFIKLIDYVSQTKPVQWLNRVM